MRVSTRLGRRRRPLLAASAALAVVAAVMVATSPASAEDGGTSDAPILGIWEVQSLSGVNNNPNDPFAGAAGDRYLRIGTAHYADGSVRPLAYRVDQAILPKLWSWNDGESVAAE